MTSVLKPRKPVMPPLKTVSWVTVGIAMRLTHRTEAEIIAAVADKPNGIKSKVHFIGESGHLLIDKEQLLAHFAEQHGPDRPAA